MAAFYALGRYLGGWKVAMVETLLFVSSPRINLLCWGRQVLGMAVCIKVHMPSDAEIETYEPGICFLAGYDCQFPLSWAMVCQSRICGIISFHRQNIPTLGSMARLLLLISDFGRWTHIYTCQRW